MLVHPMLIFQFAAETHEFTSVLRHTERRKAPGLGGPPFAMGDRCTAGVVSMIT
jgi:hypothetical protein